MEREPLVVCGLDGLALRLVEQLRAGGERVTVVAAESPTRLAAAVRALGAEIVEGSPGDVEVLRRAGIAGARAAAFVTEDDVGNVHAALAAQELNQRLRVVLRMFNTALARRVESLFGDCTVLSASGVAAPFFVDATLGRDRDLHLRIAGCDLAVSAGDRSPGPPLAALGLTRDDGTVELLPDGAPDGAVMVRRDSARAASAAQEQVRRLLRLPGSRVGAVLGAMRVVADRRFRLLVLTLGAVTTVSVLVFWLFDALSPLDALYFTVTTITTTGFGDINLSGASGPLKVYGILLIIVGATLLAIFYALLIDALVGVRLTRALGGVRSRMHDHVVVCGLGNLGVRVATQLAAERVPVVGIERNANSDNLATARTLGIPVVVASASQPEALRTAQVERARCVVAATDSDIANLEAALNARNLRPDIRIVLRLFDRDLAARVERTFGIHHSRSLSALAAPAFAAALVQRSIAAEVPIGSRVVLLAELDVEPGSELDGREVGRLERRGELRLLARRAGEGRLEWRPPADRVLAAGDRLVVAASRRGLGRAASACRAGQAVRGATGTVATVEPAQPA